jgi:hypothetical protein
MSKVVIRTFVWLSLFAAARVLAANHYINAAATGAANGNSWTDAWPAMPTTFVRGDTYYVADGNYGSVSFRTANSGTTVITIKKATIADHGTSTGWQDSFGDGTATFNGGIDFQTSNWVFDGVSRSSWTNGYGFKITHDGLGVEYTTSVDNITVRYVEVQGHGPDGAQGWPKNCSFYSPYPSSRLTWSYCYAHDSGSMFWELVNVTDGLIEYCWSARNESTAEQHSEGVYALNSTRFIFRNNVWVDVEGTGVIMMSGTGCEAYGNLIYWTTGVGDIGNGSIAGWSSYSLSNSKFYNNTIIVAPSGGYSYGINFTGGGSGNVAYNNLFYCSVNRAVVGWTGVGTHDRNWYYNVGSQSEANIFNGTGNPFVNMANYDFRPANNLGTGMNVGSPYDIDLAGKSRVAWTPGVYDYSVQSTNPLIAITPATLNFGSVVTNTTRDLTITVQNVGGGSLSGSASVTAPFSIVSGGNYTLGSNQSQVVTVRYSPIALGSASQSVNFTGGGGTTASLTAVGSSNIPPVVTALNQNATDVNPLVAGVQVYEGTVIQYSGAGSDANGDALTWQWIYTVNGGAEAVYQSGSGTVLPVNFSYGTGTAGNSYVWKLRLSDGKATAESQIATAVIATPVGGANLTIQAETGVVTAPFQIVSGSLSQPATTDITLGGRAVYTFSITNAGYYVIQTVINAPSLTENSFYLNIDAEPQDPTMAWDILPPTTGYETRLVSWRGSGTADGNEFVPKYFVLSTGTHQLIIRGREANVQLDQFAIVKVPAPPQNLRTQP